MIGFLLMILKPNRSLSSPQKQTEIKQIVEQEAEQPEIEEAVPQASSQTEEVYDKDIELIKEEIISIVVGKKRFLDARYSLDALADEITSCGRTKLSRICSKHMHGFYYMVNRPRVEFAEEYHKEHPKATKQEIALASGFTSRDNYKHAINVVEKMKKSLEFNNQ